jgi:murein DD-endopeptidase MepM/ murein hydrolase activator NlpD
MSPPHARSAESRRSGGPSGDDDIAMTVRLRVLGSLVLMLLLMSPLGVAAASTAQPNRAATATDPPWIWPAPKPRVIVEPYRAPAHSYGAGHRGVDVVAERGSPVLSPAAGVVAFRGTVVDRPLLTITHADGVVTTLEPVDSSMSPGDVLAAGDQVGTVSTGGHSAPDTLHIGVRVDGAYIDPMSMFGGAERAVLLPCCDG